MPLKIRPLYCTCKGLQEVRVCTAQRENARDVRCPSQTFTHDRASASSNKDWSLLCASSRKSGLLLVFRTRCFYCQGYATLTNNKNLAILLGCQPKPLRLDLRCLSLLINLAISDTSNPNSFTLPQNSSRKSRQNTGDRLAMITRSLRAYHDVLAIYHEDITSSQQGLLRRLFLLTSARNGERDKQS